MGKEEIKKLLAESVSTVEEEFRKYETNIKEELQSFKKKTLDRI